MNFSVTIEAIDLKFSKPTIWRELRLVLLYLHFHRRSQV